MERKPYGRLFRRAFGTPEAARDLARNLLPGEYAGLLDGADVTLDQASIVDPALRTHQTDLLLHVKPAGSPAFGVFILFEHKSYPDRWVTLQTLARTKRYAVVREDVMTYAEELVMEGQLTEKQQVLVRQLTRRFGLSDAEREGIESCEDRDALDAALDEIVVAQAKEAVLAKLGSGGGISRG